MWRVREQILSYCFSYNLATALQSRSFEMPSFNRDIRRADIASCARLLSLFS